MPVAMTKVMTSIAVSMGTVLSIGDFEYMILKIRLTLLAFGKKIPTIVWDKSGIRYSANTALVCVLEFPLYSKSILD